MGRIGRVSVGPAALSAILILAWIKAHLILRVYLGLGRSPQVRCGPGSGGRIHP